MQEPYSPSQVGAPVLRHKKVVEGQQFRTAPIGFVPERPVEAYN